MEQSTPKQRVFGSEAKKLAHELRNHLYLISLGLASIELKNGDPKMTASILQRIRQEGFRGIERVADALDDLSTSEGSEDYTEKQS